MIFKVASALDKLMPSRFVHGLYMFSKLRPEHANGILELAKQLEPKKYKDAPEAAEELKNEDEEKRQKHMAWYNWQINNN